MYILTDILLLSGASNDVWPAWVCFVKASCLRCVSFEHKLVSCWLEHNSCKDGPFFCFLVMNEREATPILPEETVRDNSFYQF